MKEFEKMMEEQGPMVAISERTLAEVTAEILSNDKQIKELVKLDFTIPLMFMMFTSKLRKKLFGNESEGEG